MKENKKIKVVVLYRVLSHYRLPIFEKLNDEEDIDLSVVHGCDFPGTKVLNSRAEHSFKSYSLKSFPIRVNTSNGLAVAPFSPGLLLLLRKLKPDVIICEGASNLPNNILAYAYAKLFGVRLVQWGLGEIKNWQKSRLRRTLDSLIESMERAADACLAYSSRGREYYRHIGIDDEKIFVAVNVVDTDRVAELASGYDRQDVYDKAHNDTELVVLFVGALNREKKVDMLIRAFRRFASQAACSSKLIIVGDGDERKRLEQIAQEEPEVKIEFTGKVIEGVGEYFLRADIFVLPGLGGLAISEAMAYGLPVIASIGDGCEVDLLGDGAGILDETLDEDALVEHLKFLSENPQSLTRMKSAAAHTIVDKHNIRTYLENLKAAITFATR